ncbi:MAG TPA: hypothetical protein DSN98_09700, partial [Thermoplasmata archaeon]
SNTGNEKEVEGVYYLLFLILVKKCSKTVWLGGRGTRLANFTVNVNCRQRWVKKRLSQKYEAVSFFTQLQDWFLIFIIITSIQYLRSGRAGLITATRLNLALRQQTYFQINYR